MEEGGSKTTIVVALISLVGVLGAAAIANWDKLKSSATQEPTPKGQTSQRDPHSVFTPKPASPSQDLIHPPEDGLLGHWISTFENSFFSVIDISREGSEIHLRAYVNTRGPDKDGCVYNATLDGKRGVVAQGKSVEWQLPTLPLPCANWVSKGFTGASLKLASNEGSPSTLATIVTMYADQSALGGSGPQTYLRR